MGSAALSTTVATEWRQRRLREIPSVNVVLSTTPVQGLLTSYEREVVAEAVAETLRDVRGEIVAAACESDISALSVSPETLGIHVRDRVNGRFRASLRRVVNATGIVLHTNLGRAPLAEAALEQVMDVGARYNNLELDLSTGERGSRYAHVEQILCRLTGAESAMVVNNNAGAVLLILAALCKGREVIVSRGELVEIGGAFRVPDVMVEGGAKLVEVGTTNKTHVRDYDAAITPETSALLKIHSSNFKIVGFTAAPKIKELAELSKRRGVPFLVDWGSGVLVDLERFGLDHESTIPELIAEGADLVTFSGDKLLGGPQAGFVVGRKVLVDACRRHPLTRALRIDKLTLAALEATLKLYLEPEKALTRIPILRALAATREELAPIAARLAAAISAAVKDAEVEVRDGFSQAGGGSLPGVEIPTVLVAVRTARPVHEVEACLRSHQPPVMARVNNGQLLLDPRALWPDDINVIASAIKAACNATART
ncbi:MAG: L-seryl-tRNA(Sec) selenium transferase [Myxococcota bacterium]